MSKKFQDPRGGHVRIYWNVVDSVAWKALSFSQQALYVAMRRRLTSNSNGNISASVASLREQGFRIASAALAEGLRALVVVGLIDVTRQGGKVGRGQSIPTLFRFTDEPSHEWRTKHIPAHKATEDWRRFATVDEAKTAVENNEAAARVRAAAITAARRSEVAASASKKNSSLRKSKRSASKSEAQPLRKTKTAINFDFEIRSVGRSAELAQSLVH